MLTKLIGQRGRKRTAASDSSDLVIYQPGFGKKGLDYISMTPRQRKQRIDYLWRRVREAVESKAILDLVQREELNRNREHFGLDRTVEYALPESQ